MTNVTPASRKRAKTTVNEVSVSATAAEPVAVPAKKARAVKARATAAVAPVAPVKAKLVRDSFTIPKPEYESLAALKRRAIGLGVEAKKSELIRAGIAALTGMSDKAFLTAVKAVPNLKTGRPKAGQA